MPGGHNVLWDGNRKPFITPMRECNSIPLRHSDVVVDIGAYVGTYAIRCARFPVKKVIAYEPTPHSFNVLSLTRLPNLKVVQAAVVGYDTDSVELFVSKGIGVTNSTVLTSQKAYAVSVPAIRYEEAIAEATIVKIDVEGAEYSYKIVQPNLRAVIIDFHPVPKRPWLARAEQIIGELIAAGFQTVVEPDFFCGWTRAGSWIRPMKTEGEFESMMQGKVCCGCGVKVDTLGRGLCTDCWPAWSKKHREGFSRDQ